jgi:peptide/nickel transport system permease protein
MSGWGPTRPGIVDGELMSTMRRLAQHGLRTLSVLAAGSLLAAILVRTAPGFGTNELDLDSRLNAESHRALHGAQGTEGGFLRFYIEWCGRVLHGDLGTSVALNEPVRQLLVERIPETAKTLATGLTLAWTLGLGLALLSSVPGMRCLGWAAWFAASVLLCVPAAVLAIGFVLTGAPGRLAVGLIVFPKVFEFTRNLLARSAAMPHVLAARARGVSEPRVLFHHVLPVTAGQIFALAGVSVCMALAACIPVEVLCDLPGIGQLAWKAALGRDLPLLVMLTVLVTTATLAANTAAETLSRTMRGGEAR